MKDDGWNSRNMNVRLGSRHHSKTRDYVLLPGCHITDSIFNVCDTQVFTFTEGEISHKDPNSQKEEYEVQQAILSRIRDPLGPTIQLEIFNKEY